MSKNTKIVCEAAVMTALALALSYVKIPIGLAFGGFGGSIDFVMIPILVLAIRRGFGWGVACGLVFGTLKFFFAGGVAINWQSMLLDYSLAYAAVGFAGLLKKAPVAGAVLGCVCRFIIHYISGVTIYAMWMPEEFMDMTMTSPAVYSLLYNGTYMVPNSIIAIIVIIILSRVNKGSILKPAD
ncbi:MAG: energy-coupled thiamine transporter ThiT [Oscillospiraceae bacterium]|nr:energy-coupled thiamine transporter ThiT [Oscillospiraceae bacterium]